MVWPARFTPLAQAVWLNEAAARAVVAAGAAVDAAKDAAVATRVAVGALTTGVGAAQALSRTAESMRTMTRPYARMLVSPPVSDPVEHSLPGGLAHPTGPERALRVGGQLGLAAAIRLHQKYLFNSAAVGVERNLFAIGRPGRRALVGRVVGQACHLAAIRMHDIELTVAIPV